MLKEQNNERLIEQIIHESVLFAIIIRSEFSSQGINFFTPESFSQQLAYMRRKKGYVIEPHLHNKVQREVFNTQEVLFIKSGKVRVDFYDNNKKYLKSSYLAKGDVILLSSGGHGFFMEEESEIIEVKQGPYAGDSDKTRFQSDPNLDLKV